MAGLSYVLITSARNEADYIEHTLRSVAAQTVPPLKWIVVDDASRDGTADLVERAAQSHAWIELVRAAPREGRNFAAKARNLAMAYERVRALPFDVVGNLDADISFPEDHMAFLLAQFASDPRLGVAGTAYLEESFDSRTGTLADSAHVSGQCQLFRRACWEEIGGYAESPAGGVDWLAVRTARMKGWKTRSFHERTFFHHKPMGTAGAGAWKMRFQYGQKDYRLGNHPLWELLRAAFQMRNRPYVVGGALMLAGYVWAAVRRIERIAPPDVMAFHRAEQMAKLRGALRGRSVRAK